MKFSIIINTHNQKKYLKDAIKTCLKQNFKNYEILKTKIFFLKLISWNPLIWADFIKNKKNLKYYYIKQMYSQPELNQLDKIFFGLKKSIGDYIVLMDGDDKFSKEKLYYLNKLIEKKKCYN